MADVFVSISFSGHVTRISLILILCILFFSLILWKSVCWARQVNEGNEGASWWLFLLIAVLCSDQVYFLDFVCCFYFLDSVTPIYREICEKVSAGQRRGLG